MPRHYSGKWVYDVFVCFRGEDTRRLFTSHIAGNLIQESIRAFTDEIFERTEDIDDLIAILRDCAMSVVIFSESFADSAFCLDEVATIAEIMEKFGHRVLPVFYGVDPEDVSGDFGSYSSVIDAELKPSLEKKKTWMDALKAVAKCAGRTTEAIKDEYQLCKTIVDDVMKKLIDMSSSGKFNNLVGMAARVSNIERLLAEDNHVGHNNTNSNTTTNNNNINPARVIGLWGMGGVGKTTLARASYQMLTSPTNRLKHHFVSNVSNSCKTPSGVEELARQLYSNLLSENNLSLEDLDVDHRRERLSRLKVVVVLDNVETVRQLGSLLLGEVSHYDPVAKVFGPGSVIIITSRNRRVLQHAGAKIHDMEGLNSGESLELFRLHAFKQVPMMINGTSTTGGPCEHDLMDKESRLAVSYCKGNPLALKVLGGALFGKKKTYWYSFLAGLGLDSEQEIHDVLSTSYHALKGEEQRLFMDVACFHFNTPKTRLIEYLATSYDQSSAYSLVEDLIDKSMMFTIPSNDYDEVVVVHDLLTEMAWNIVKKGPIPSRIKNPSDVRKLFAMKYEGWRLFKSKYIHTKDAFNGGKTIQSLALNLSKTRKKKICLGANAFEGMNSLRLLGFYAHKAAELLGVPEVHLVDGRLDTLPNELRWLEWTGYHLKYLPQKFQPEKLVTLSLRHSRIKRCWEKGVEPKLVHLVTLDLSYSINLSVVPNLSGSKKLELLRLKGCKSLVELPSFVQDLDKLVEVDLCECLNLIRVPARLNSRCLKYVGLARCPNLTFCPEIHRSEDVLQVLDLEGTPIGLDKVKDYRNYLVDLHGKCITTLESFRLWYTTMNDVGDDDDDDDDDGGGDSDDDDVGGGGGGRRSGPAPVRSNLNSRIRYGRPPRG